MKFKTTTLFILFFTLLSFNVKSQVIQDSEASKEVKGNEKAEFFKSVAESIFMDPIHEAFFGQDDVHLMRWLQALWYTPNFGFGNNSKITIGNFAFGKMNIVSNQGERIRFETNLTRTKGVISDQSGRNMEYKVSTFGKLTFTDDAGNTYEIKRKIFGKTILTDQNGYTLEFKYSNGLDLLLVDNYGNSAKIKEDYRGNRELQIDGSDYFKSLSRGNFSNFILSDRDGNNVYIDKKGFGGRYEITDDKGLFIQIRNNFRLAERDSVHAHIHVHDDY